MARFHVTGLPIPTPVRNEDTGTVEDGYRLTVVDDETGARAVIELPRSKYSAENVARLGEYELDKHREVLAAFQAQAPTG